MFIKAQRIIRWIPVVNFATAFFWIFNCLRYRATMSERLKTILTVIVLNVLITVPRIVLSVVLNNYTLDVVMTWITVPFNFYAFSFPCVRAQERIIARNAEEHGARSI